VFEVQGSVFAPDGTLDPSSRVSNCGYNPVTMVTAMARGLLLISTTLGMSQRKSPIGSLPVVSIRNGAISSSSQVPTGFCTDRLVFRKLRRGAIISANRPQAGDRSIMPANAWDYANVWKSSTWSFLRLIIVDSNRHFAVASCDPGSS
jgi:hypothetical protein